jgi:hypothetical protein
VVTPRPLIFELWPDEFIHCDTERQQCFPYQPERDEVSGAIVDGPKTRAVRAWITVATLDRKEASMRTADINPVLARLFSELVDGAAVDGGAFILNGGDGGLLQSLENISAVDASRSVNEGATIAAHAQHLRYGLSLMNRRAREGGNPFANAQWDEAWTISNVDATAWDEIRTGLRDETHGWLGALSTPRDVGELELAGMAASIAHLAYHLGAIRQINKATRGPKEGTFH